MHHRLLNIVWVNDGRLLVENDCRLPIQCSGNAPSFTQHCTGKRRSFTQQCMGKRPSFSQQCRGNVPSFTHTMLTKRPSFSRVYVFVLPSVPRLWYYRHTYHSSPTRHVGTLPDDISRRKTPPPHIVTLCFTGVRYNHLGRHSHRIPDAISKDRVNIFDDVQLL